MQKQTRREFLKLAGKTAIGATLLSACGIPERELILESPLDAPEDLLDGDDSWYATTWPEGTNAEGVVARVIQGRVKKLAGNVDHPLNRGKHSPHYDSGIQLLYHPDRITQPLYRRGEGAPLNPISWEQAIDIFTEAARGATTVVTQPVSGSLEYILRSVTGGLPNVRHRIYDTFEQGVLQEAMERLYGSACLPNIDIKSAQTVLSFGADWLSSWISPLEFGYQYSEFRNEEAGEGRGYLIHAEPRFSMTAASADTWLPVRPGYEGALALAIARVIIDEELVPSSNIAQFTSRLPSNILRSYSVGAVAELTRVSEEAIYKAARRFGSYLPAVAFGGGSASAQRNGLFNTLAIYSLNALVGNTNIMENAEFELESLRTESYGTSYRDWQNEELAQWRGGHNDTVILRGVDLVHDLPRAARVSEALSAVDNVIVFANFLNDTALGANLVLPETTFLENWGVAVPNPAPGYPVVSVQQPVSGTRPDAEPGTGPRSFADLMLGLLPAGINGRRSSREVVSAIIADIYDNFGGQGSVRASSQNLFERGVLQRGGWWDVQTPSAASIRANSLFDVTVEAATDSDAPSGDGAVMSLVPFQTVSRLELLAPTAWSQQIGDPLSTVAWATWAEINSAEAERLGIREGDMLYVRSRHGEVQVAAYPNPATPEGVLGVPVGFGYVDNGRYAANVGDNILNVLVDEVNPETGALAWAGTKVRVARRGNRIKMPKLEGDQEPVREAEAGVPIIVVAPGESAEDVEHANEELYREQFRAGGDNGGGTSDETEDDGH